MKGKALIILACCLGLLCGCRRGSGNVRKYLDEAQRALDAGDYGRAQYLYYQLKQKHPEEQKIRLGLGYCYQKQNHDEYAAGEFSKALELSGQTNGLAWLGLGEYYRRLRKSEDCRICLENAVSCLPGDSVALCNLGNAYYREGEYASAAANYQKALKAGDSRGELYAVIGLCHQRTRNWRDAVRYMEKARMEMPGNKKLPLQLAYIYKENFDDPAKAEECFLAYAKLDPNGSRALRSAFVMPEKERPDEAAAEEDRSVRDPNAGVAIVDVKPKEPAKESEAESVKSRADTLEHDGRLKRLEGDHRGAVKDFSEALALDPSRGYLNLEIGDIYAGEFQDAELLNALRSYRAYADFCKGSRDDLEVASRKIRETSLRYNQAEAKIREMREREAREKESSARKEEERQTALQNEMARKLAQARSYDQLLGEGAKLMGEGKIAEAREVLQRAVIQNENDYRAYYHIGLCVFNQVSGCGDQASRIAKCEEAVMYLGKAIEKKPDYAQSYALRGIIYKMLDRSEEAMSDFSYYLEIVGEDDTSPLTRRILPIYQNLAGAR